MHSRIIQQAAIGMLINNRQRLTHSMSELTKAGDRFLANNNAQLQSLVQRIPSESRHRINSASERIEQLQRQLLLSSSQFLSQTVNNVNHLERIVTLTNPQNILRKGYSITYVNGVPVRDTSQLKVGDSVTTILDGGRFESEVKTIQSS